MRLVGRKIEKSGKRFLPWQLSTPLRLPVSWRETGLLQNLCSAEIHLPWKNKREETASRLWLDVFFKRHLNVAGNSSAWPWQT
jgi:hypothetical protein